MSGDWLSLSEVAKLLGIHPSTVRNWADQGKLPVHRTQGGHRRFRRKEVELWTQSQHTRTQNEGNLVAQNAIGLTRIQISEGRLSEEGWYQKLDQSARQQYRRSGRVLLQGLTAYLASDEDSAKAEARSLGLEYATIARRHGLSSLDAVCAFLFFRNVLVESMISVFESSAIYSAQVWGNMLAKITSFTDQVLLSLLETYQFYSENHR